MIKCPHCGKIICEEKWQETAKRLGNFHEERQKELGVAKAGRAKRGWSIRDSAKSQRISKSQMQNYWTVYTALRDSPKLEKMENVQSVLAWIRRNK